MSLPGVRGDQSISDVTTVLHRIHTSGTIHGLSNETGALLESSHEDFSQESGSFSQSRGRHRRPSGYDLVVTCPTKQSLLLHQLRLWELDADFCFILDKVSCS